MSQLRLDGSEVVTPVVRIDRQPLSGAQHQILAHVRDHGYIRSVEAGVLAHRLSKHPQHAQMYRHPGIGCCPYASTDGNEVCKRLMKRGLLRRDPTTRGRWIPAGQPLSQEEPDGNSEADDH